MSLRRRDRLATMLTLLLALLAMSPAAASAAELDFDLPEGAGHFYRQANGRGGAGEAGFAITNAEGVPFWDEYQRLGGPAALGYPVSRRFLWDGFVVQAMQKAVLQWRPETKSVAFANVLDRMHELGKDSWLQTHRQTPPPFDSSPDAGLTWEQAAQRHWGFLDANPAIKARYWADSAAVDHFGLPVSHADTGNAFVIRTQRAVFQQWKDDVPWARQGEVTVANAGDLAKEAGLFPPSATTPELPPGDSPISAPGERTRDWRAPGFVAAVGGQLYDPGCAPLRSVGINVPNLSYREGLAETLEWMRQHRIRWMRVFATGHALGQDRAPRGVEAAVAALRSLVAGVEAFNAAHQPAEAIYVLVSLTDYYVPGVPGDRYAYDHPWFRLSPVLPAPWFRAGVRQFDFEQEQGLGRVFGMPNHEVHYKPWVRQVVASLAQSPALMGWQLGNELKARGSPRNGISIPQAYDWYLAFTRDIAETIRSLDRNHLIFTGTQYIAEQVDWEYRPNGQLHPDRVEQYRRYARQMLDIGGGSDGWNVWTVTVYDFNAYPLDDASLFSEAGVPVVATEYGFTRGTPAETQARFGGDQAAALRSGLAAPWQDLAGQAWPRQWGVPELLSRGLLAGVAPWGAPAPGPTAGLDADSVRGIGGSPDEAALWAAWRDVGASLEEANRAAGPSGRCLAFRSPP